MALKRVQPSTRAKGKALENEIRTMHAIRHPNIIRCHEAYSFNGSVWIVMEAMDVGCLTHVLDFLRTKGYLLDEAHIAYILLEALQGLWAMHSRGRMHRDIKSDNVLVSSTGEVKLADFEYTAILTEDAPKRNTMVGTAWWMAPETVRSSYYDYGADVWSIGILAIECAEWVPPLFGMECAKRSRRSSPAPRRRVSSGRTCGARSLRTLCTGASCGTGASGTACRSCCAIRSSRRRARRCRSQMCSGRLLGWTRSRCRVPLCVHIIFIWQIVPLLAYPLYRQ